MSKFAPYALWVTLAGLALWALAAAAGSPYLAFRQSVYIVSGFAGIVALILMVFQPLLAAGMLPGLGPLRSRKLHIALGVATLSAVGVHVGGLWITSPPDVVDALTFTSPTPFSAWGVIAMWSLWAAGIVTAVKLAPRRKRVVHGVLVSVAVLTTLPHAWLIEGTMGVASKAALLLAAAIALAMGLHKRRTLWLLRPRA